MRLGVLADLTRQRLRPFSRGIHGRVARYIGVAMVAAAAGLAVGGAGLVVPVAAVVAAASLQAFGWRSLVVALIGSTFVTVFRFSLLGANFRLEHLLLLTCVIAMVAAGRGPSLVSAARDRTAMLFAAFVLWSAFISALRASNPAESLLIDGWLALDWLFLVVLLAAWRDARGLAGVAARWAGIAAAVAIVLWVSAVVAGTGLGVVTVDVERGTTAAGLSFEPNLLGFTLAVFGFLVLTGVTGLAGRTRTAVLMVSVVGIALSLTRAAIVGFGGGLLVWALIGGRAAGRRVLRVAGTTAVIALLLVKLAPGVGTPIVRRTGHVLEFGSGTGQLRVESWGAALDDLHGLSWLTGFGTNSFGQHHLDPTQPGVPAYLGNLPLQILYDAGIVGVVLLGLTLLSLVRRKRMSDGLGPGLMTIYLACAVATSPFWYGTTWVLVAIACIDRRGDVGRSPPSVPRLPPSTSMRIVSSPQAEAFPNS